MKKPAAKKAPSRRRKEARPRKLRSAKKPAAEEGSGEEERRLTSSPLPLWERVRRLGAAFFTRTWSELGEGMRSRSERAKLRFASSSNSRLGRKRQVFVSFSRQGRRRVLGATCDEVHASQSCCPAITRKPPSRRRWQVSARRCPTRPSTSMTTTAATARSRWRAPPGRSSGPRRDPGQGQCRPPHVRRCGRRHLLSWPMAMRPMDAASAPALVAARARRAARHAVVGARVTQADAAIGAATRWAMRCSPACSPGCSGAASPTSCVGLPRLSRRFVKSFPVHVRRLRDRDRDQRPCA